MSLVDEFPVLLGLDKSGKHKIWKASVYVNPDQTAYSIIEYGLQDGKLQSVRRDVLEGKNIGKRNQTTPLQQCIAETDRKWRDKRDKENYKQADREEKENYKHADREEEENLQYLPMLAQPLKKEKLVLPCYVQPKLDGLRCLFYRNKGNWVAQSRSGLTFTTVDHIKDTLPMVDDVVFDGELYTTTIPFETLAGLLKKKKLTDADREKLKQVEYHCYDIYLPFEPDVPFEERSARLMALGVPNPVETELIHSVEQFERKFSLFTAEGYEGIMVRAPKGKYQLNYRGKELCKYKEFEEDEFLIIDFTQGEGRDEGTVIWICETPCGKHFSVRPRGSVDQRREWFRNANQFVGQKLTVVYQNLTEQGVPRFPVGKAIRDGF